MNSIGLPNKRCCKCLVYLDKSRFGVDVSRADSLQNACRECTNEYSLQYRAARRPPVIPIPEGMKRCGHCRDVKLISEFGKNNAAKDGLMYQCRPCARKSCISWRSQNTELVRQLNRKYAAGKPRPKNANENGRKYYARHRDNILSRSKEIRAEKRHDPDFCERERLYQRVYGKKRRDSMPWVRIRHSLAARIHKKVKRVNQNGNTMDVIGCSPKHLMWYLERKFQPGMSFTNYGKWHLDHKRPCKLFDLTDFEQQRACFHFSNLQPMWGEDNIKKGATYG